MVLVYRFGIYSLAGTFTLMPLLVLPAMVGVLVDQSTLSEAQAGWSASLGFFGSALVALAMAFRMHHMDLRKTAMIAFGLAAAGDAVSGFLVDQTAVFLALRFITGVGAGAAYTAVVAAFAREPHTDRGYGLFITLQFIVSGLGLYLLPVYSGVLSVTGMYLSFAALDVLGLFLCRHLPHEVPVRKTGLALKSELSVLLARATVFGTLGFALFEAANTAQFTYVERYGTALALSDNQLGTAMMIGSLAGIPGAFAIILTGKRFGRTAPLTLGVAIGIAGLLVLIGSRDYSAYMAGAVMMGFSWAFCLPYIQGLLAALDPHGSAVAAGAASSTIGGAAGPGLAALIVADGRYHAVFYVAAAILLASLVSFYLAAPRKQLQQEKLS